MAQGFYNLTDTLKTELEANTFVNTVTYGDIFDVDLNKKDIFALAHFIVNSVSNNGQTLVFNISLLCMDIVDESKSNVTDKFIGNNNEQDILNTQLSVINTTLAKLRRGDLFRSLYQLQENVSIEPFTDRFENRLAGWAATFNVIVANGTSTC